MDLKTYGRVSVLALSSVDQIILVPLQIRHIGHNLGFPPDPDTLLVETSKE